MGGAFGNLLNALNPQPDDSQPMSESLGLPAQQAAALTPGGAGGVVPSTPTPAPVQQQQPSAPQTQGPPSPRPVLLDFIQNMIHPNAVQMANGRPASRTAVLESFLGNVISAMGQGFANEGHGPGSFARGFGAAATEPYQRSLQQYQLGQQAQEQQARIAQQNAQTQLTQAQLAGLPAEQAAKIASMTAQPRFDPTTGQYLGNLTDKQMEAFVKGQGAARTTALSKEAIAQLNSGAVKKYLPTADGRYVALDAQGNPLHVVDGAVNPAMMQRVTSTQQLVPDGSGGYLVIPKTTTSGVVPPAGSALSQVQSKVPALGANMTPQQQVQAKVPALGAAANSPRHITTNALGVAYDPQSNTYIQETATEAAQAGHQQFQKITAKESEENRQLNNRLADVATKITRYEDAAAPGKLSVDDKSTIARILQDDKFKLGAFGAEIPVDAFNQFFKANRAYSLSDNGKKALLSYLNARESMVGYQRVLSGGSKSNEKAMQLNLDALPTPVYDDGYIREGLNQFTENVGIAGQGLPRMKGITSAADIFAARQPKQVGFNIPRPFGGNQ